MHLKFFFILSIKIFFSEAENPRKTEISYDNNFIDTQTGDFRGKTKFSQSYDYDEGLNGGFYNEESIPGRDGVDFPAHTNIPKTSFSCKGKRIAGYYADIETDCQVFHICVERNRKISFICPKGSVFNQKVSVCDWWYEVDCQLSEVIAELTNDFLKSTPIEKEQSYQYEEDYDLSLASSGGNDKNKRKPK